MKREQKILTWLTSVHLANDGFSFIFPTLLPFIARDLNLSYIEVGSLIGVVVVILSIGQMLMGTLSDRFQNKKNLVIFGFIILSMGLFFISISSSFLLLIVAASVVAIGESVYHPVGVSILSHNYTNPNKGKAFAIHGSGGAVGMIIFPMLSGILAEFYGWRFVFESLSFVGIAVGIWFFLSLGEPLKGTALPSSPYKQPSFTLEIIITTLAFGFVVMVARGFSTFFPVQLYILKYSPALIGMYLTVFYGVGILGQYVAAPLIDKYELRNIILYSFAVTGFFFALLIKTSETYSMILLLTISGFFYSMLWPVMFAHYTNIIPKDSTGKTLGFFFSASGIMGAFAPVIMGYLIDSFNISIALLVLPVACLAGSLLMLKTH